jgi:hypothetical protein
MSPNHQLIAMSAINDLILEMSYVSKIKNLTINRRISINFRDNALFQIFKVAQANTKQFTASILQGLQSG